MDHPWLAQANARRSRAPATGHYKLQAAVDLLGRGLCVQRDLVHVAETLAQGFGIDLQPIGLRVSVEDAHDLLDGTECILASAQWVVSQGNCAPARRLSDLRGAAPLS